MSENKCKVHRARTEESLPTELVDSQKFKWGHQFCLSVKKKMHMHYEWHTHAHTHTHARTHTHTHTKHTCTQGLQSRSFKCSLFWHILYQDPHSHSRINMTTVHTHRHTHTHTHTDAHRSAPSVYTWLKDWKWGKCTILALVKLLQFLSATHTHIHTHTPKHTHWTRSMSRKRAQLHVHSYTHTALVW